MSKQQGNSPDEPETCNKSPPKKRKGKYELWQRFNPHDAKDTWFAVFRKEWRKVRSYETKELAEQNMEAMKRKWSFSGKDCWQYEIRVKE